MVAWDGTIWHAGLVLGPDRIPYRVYEGEPEQAPHVNRPRLVPAVAADGMAVTRERFVEVGGFDETLAEDLTDADLCLRLRTRGLPIAYAPAAVLTSPRRAEPGTRDDFHRTAKEFTARWSALRVRSDAVVCSADGTDAGAEWNRSWRLPRPTAAAASAAEPGGLPAIAWTSHFLERGGYTEEAIAAIQALDDAGLRVIASPVALDGRSSAMPALQAARLADFLGRDLSEDFVHVAHIGANRFKRHPAAMRNVGRTMFETDRLPDDWRDQCNLMDEIWVPSDHNLRTFARAGVEVSKLHKIPETFDAALFQPDVEPLPVAGAKGFVFLSMFSWLPRKGWDVLLRAWCAEFDRHDDVTLVLKTDVDHAPGVDTRREVDAHLRRLLGRDPKKGPRVVVLDRPLASTEMPRLYRTSDAFVLPTRGEGWGRPLMEAMAMGLPAIATRWSGHLEFMDDDNSYLVDYELGPAPKDSWFAGHRWAEPSVKALRRALRRVYEDRSEAAEIGRRARADVLERCSPELLADAVRDRLEAIDRHPIHVSLASAARLDQSGGPTVVHRTTRADRLTACVVVPDDAARPSVAQCLASVDGVADSEVVVEAGSRGDMAAVRNEALDQASGRWVLMLDATQTLDPASAEVVAELVDRNRFVGYTARERRQVGLDGAISAVATRTVCLFPRRPDLRYVGRVGEQLVGRQPELRFRLTPSSVVVHQHRRDGDLDPVALARRQLPVLEQTRRDEPDEPFHRYNLGVALDRLGLHVEAEQELRTAIELAPPHTVWGAPAHAALSHAVRAQRRSDEAVGLSKRATKLDPDWAQGWALLGATLADAGRPKAALRAYKRALDCLDETALAPSDPDDVAVAVRAGMGRIHLARGEYGEAMTVLRGAIASHPGSARLRVEIAQAHAAMGQTSAALGQLERAAELERGAPDAFIGISDFFTRRAEEALLRGLAGNPESGALLERIERLRSARAVF